jgi:cysteine desulfurase / selenocysteine lyase
MNPHPMSAQSGFSTPDGDLWLNTAHQGVMPLASADAVRTMVEAKLRPALLSNALFRQVPDQLRAAWGQVIGAAAEDVILANSASYGLHLLARCLPLQSGDEVLVLQRDFPSDVLPWLLAEKERGIRVRRIRLEGTVLTASELQAHISPRTRVFCATWVNSLTGYAMDLAAIGAVCHNHGVKFVANLSQGLGSLPIDIKTSNVDAAVAVGFKWLCGPYGTGVLWIDKGLRARLRPAKAYWLAMMSAEELANSELTIELHNNLSAAAFDIFGTANFFNSAAMLASLNHLLTIGMPAVYRHDELLVDAFVRGLNRDLYDLQSANNGPTRSSLIFISHRDPGRNEKIQRELASEGVHVAARAGSLRISPHIHNSGACVEHCLALLHRARR